MAGPSSADIAPSESTQSNFGPGIPPIPADATPEQKDAHWFKYVYRGDQMPQLTWRAVLMGGFLGMLMSAANLYTTLSIGWAFGIAITACVLSFVMWNFIVLTSGKRVSQMSVLENACMASTASAAGYSTGSTIATMFGALVLLKDVPEGTPLSSVKTWDVTPPWVVVIFTLCTGLMGVFLAIPMKRQQINHEQLPFPSGIAAAETLRSLYSASKEAIKKAYALVIALAMGLLIGFLRAGDDVLDKIAWLKRFFEWFPQNLKFSIRIPEKIDLHIIDRLYPGSRFAVGFAFEPSALLIAAGMIVGLRTSISLVVSSLILYGVVGPKLAEQDARYLVAKSDTVLVGYADAVKSVESPKAAHDAGLAAIDRAADAAAEFAAADRQKAKDGARKGAAGAQQEIDDQHEKRVIEAVARAASKAGMDGDRVETVAQRAARSAEEGGYHVAMSAALTQVERLAKAKGVSARPIEMAAREAEKQANARTDLEAGEKIKAAVIAVAQRENIDVKAVKAAADEAAAEARTGPGRTGAEAARAKAYELIYDGLERDPRSLDAEAKAAAKAANEKADADVESAVLAAVKSETGKAGLDAASIDAAVASAKAAAAGSSADGLSPRAHAAREELEAQAAKSSASVEAVWGVGKAVVQTAEENERDTQTMINGIRGGAAGPLMNDFSTRDMRAAQEAAEVLARKDGKTYKQTVVAGEIAAEGARYKRNLIWDVGGHQIVLTRWSLWGGTAMMVFASLMSIALQWKTVMRAFLGVKAGANEHANAAELSRIEVPGSWMVLGMVPITLAMVWLQIQAFHVAWYAGVIAVAMSFVLSLVASRATGETDTTPIGAMGKVMQLMFAALAPKNISANLASAGIAANSASSSADLLTDLKTGYLLGANPRKQFLAQFFGCFFGTLAIVPIWYLMVPDRAKLETFALPSTRAWEAVARVLVKGVNELPASAVWAIFIGAALGIFLPLMERLLPAKARRFMPSATGMGLAWVMPFQNAFSFFLGAVIAVLWGKIHTRSRDAYNVPIASGLVAGESLMAAALAILATVVGLLAAS